MNERGYVSCFVNRKDAVYLECIQLTQYPKAVPCFRVFKCKRAEQTCIFMFKVFTIFVYPYLSKPVVLSLLGPDSVFSCFSSVINGNVTLLSYNVFSQVSVTFV